LRPGPRQGAPRIIFFAPRGDLGAQGGAKGAHLGAKGAQGAPRKIFSGKNIFKRELENIFDRKNFSRRSAGALWAAGAAV